MLSKILRQSLVYPETLGILKIHKISSSQNPAIPSAQLNSKCSAVAHSMTKNKINGDVNGSALFTIPKNTLANISSVRPSIQSSSPKRAAMSISGLIKILETQSTTALLPLKLTLSFALAQNESSPDS